MTTLNWQELAGIATVLSILASGLFAAGGWTINWLTDCVGKRLESVMNAAETRIVNRVEGKVDPLAKAHAELEKAHAENTDKILWLETQVKFLLRGGGQIVRGASTGGD